MYSQHNHWDKNFSTMHLNYLGQLLFGNRCMCIGFFKGARYSNQTATIGMQANPNKVVNHIMNLIIIVLT